MRRALVMYKSIFFDPRSGIAQQLSAGIIAHDLYYSLVNANYDVDYIDPSEANTFTLQDYDLFIGQPDQWLQAANRSRARTKILFLPTTHPLRRNKLMRQSAKRHKKAVNELLLYGANGFKAFNIADFIFQIGNTYAIEALVKHGIPISKIVHLHYGVHHLKVSKDSRQFSATFLHLCSNLGLRKGVLDAIALFESLKKTEQLTLVGSIDADFVKPVNEAIERNPKISFVSWLEPHTEAYKAVIDTHAWMLFPSVEEAEPGTMLEAMSQGLVPIAQPSGSGIDWHVLGSKPAPLKAQIEKTTTISNDEYRVLSEKSKHYVDLFHDPHLWNVRLQQLWKRLQSNQNMVYPHVSIVLCVFNKAPIIVELLKALWRNTKSYPWWDIHVVYDGCTDNTKELAQKVMSPWNIQIYEYEKPNIFETRANNFGMKQAKGEYVVILQDDNFVHEQAWLEQIIGWMEQYPKVAVVGGLAGVNYFRKDSQIDGLGVSRTENEVYQRLDWNLQPELKTSVYEVDAVMRGPTFFRKHLLEEHGYLDESYAPLFNDDMDYCFKIRSLGYSVFCYPINVQNRRLTMALYDPLKGKRFAKIMRERTILLYQRWEHAMSQHDYYLQQPRPNYGQCYDSRSKLTQAVDYFKFIFTFLTSINWLNRLNIILGRKIVS